MRLLFLLFLSIASIAHAGLADSYVRDANICTDPDVIHCDMFEGSEASIEAAYNGGSSSGIGVSTNVPSASTGVQSVKLMPVSINGTLYLQLPTNYTTLCMRCYVNFLGNVSHHAGIFLGGYNPPTSFPIGDAGLRDNLFISSIQQQGTNGSGPQTHLGTYNQWSDMTCVGGAPSGCYGRNMLSVENVPLAVGTWRHLEMCLTTNSTVSGHDGTVTYYVDGVTIQSFATGSPTGAYDGTGDWISNPAGSAFPGLAWRDALTYGINWIKLQNYADFGSPQDVLFDHLVVATQYVGPINTGASAPGHFAPSFLRHAAAHPLLLVGE